MDSTERIQALRNLLAEIEAGMLKFGRKQETATEPALGRTLRGGLIRFPMRLSKMIRYANEDAFLALTGKFGAVRETLNLLESEIDQEMEDLREEIDQLGGEIREIGEKNDL